MALLLPTRVLPSQSQFPANPYEGQHIVQSLPGRNIEWGYAGGLWTPKRSFGSTTLYVDNGLGTDDVNHGFAAGASALRTIAYALSMIPILNPNNATDIHEIQLPAGAYAENLTAIGYQGSTHIKGTWTTVASLVATGGVQGAGANTAQITGAFVAGAYDHLMVRFTSGANNGLYRVVGRTNVGTLYLLGFPLNAAPLNGDTYDVLDWGTTLTGIHSVLNCPTFHFQALRMTPGGAVNPLGMIYGYRANCGQLYCDLIVPNATPAVYADFSQMQIWQSIVRTTAAGALVGARTHWAGTLDIQQSGFYGMDIVNSYGVIHQDNGMGWWVASEVSGWLYGSFTYWGGAANWLTVGVNSFVHGNAVGLRADYVSSQLMAGGITFGVRLDGVADVNTIANTSAVAANFASIA